MNTYIHVLRRYIPESRGFGAPRVPPGRAFEARLLQSVTRLHRLWLPCLEVQGRSITGSFKGGVRIPLQGLWGSVWVDERQLKSWHMPRDLELQSTYNWVETLLINQS